MIGIKIDDLLPWRAVLRHNGLWQVIDPDGHPITVMLDEHSAKVAAVAPTVLRFLSLFLHRPNAPAKIDICNMLARSGIELEL
jgi:hypothetical protein